MHKYEDRQKIYQEHPEFWFERIRKRRGIRYALSTDLHLERKLTYRQVGAHLGVSKERIRQMVVLSLQTVAWQSKMEVIKKSMTKELMGKALTPEEFSAIKDMQFRGMTQEDAIMKSGRSNSTISRVYSSSTIDEYFQKSRNAYVVPYKGVGRDNLKMVKMQPVVQPTTRWGKLRAFRERFDEVLIEFMLEELDIKHKELMEENESLKQEVERLKQRLEDVEQPDFVKKLQEKLTPEQTNGVAKQEQTQ